MTKKILLGISLAFLTTTLWAAEADVTKATTMEQETASPAVAPMATKDAAEKSGFSRGSVVRSAFTTAIENRQPASDLKTISNNDTKVYYYTELRDMSGQTATHRWEYNGEVKAEVKFNVNGPRWRVWSSKTLVPGWTGDWKVSVINGAGEVISEDVFKYTAAETTPPAAPVMAPATAQ